nr:amidohydrolase family protein [Rhodococcus wratislaviensis]GLK33414.1 5-methylthioadenosine/S-adenosylhomocysteine deaminase [Rhodococcus wratislaviensis]
MSTSPLTLVHGRYVIASAKPPDGEVIRDGAVAVIGDRVVEVGAYCDLDRRYPDARRIGSAGHIVMPGLINSHHHGWGLSAFALGASDNRLESWLIDLAALPHVDVYYDTLFAATRLVRSGVTTVQHSGISRDFGQLRNETESALRAYATIGMRVAYALQARDRNTFAYEDDDTFLSRLSPGLAQETKSALAQMGEPSFEEFESLARELVSRYSGSALIKVLLSAEGPEWCSEPLLNGIRSLADELHVGIHMHCLETPHQREYFRSRYGKSVLSYLDDLNFLRSDLSLAHAVWMTEEDIRLCAERGVSVCHNPSSNLRLRVGVAPLPEMLDRGINVALGLDSSGINDDDDMLQEMGLAARLHSMPRGLNSKWAPGSVDILRMATIEGAKALGIGDEAGSLEAGMRADLVLLDYESISGPYMADSVNPIDAVVYRARNRHVDMVMINGDLVLKGGEFTSIDEPSVREQLAASARNAPSPRVTAWTNALRKIRPEVEKFYAGWAEPSYKPSYFPNSLL